MKLSIFNKIQNKEKNLKENNNENKIIFLFIILITFTFFGIFIKADFATDTYFRLIRPTKSNFLEFFHNGRILPAIWYGICSLLNFGYKKLCFSSFIIAIFSITIAIYRLYKIMNRKIDNKVVCVCLSIVMVINPFSIELFLFIEKGFMLFSICCAVLAAEQFINYLENKTKKSILFALIFMTIGVFSYQASLAFFILISCFYITLSSHNIKDFILNNVIMGVIYVIPTLIDYCLVTNGRVGSEIDWGTNLKITINGIRDMFLTFKILPKYTMVLLFIFDFITFILTLILNKDDKKTNIIHILYIIYIGLMSFIFSFILTVFQSTSAIWFTARSTYAFSSIWVILLAYILNISKNENETIKKVSIAIIIIFLCIQYYRFNLIELDHYILNNNDKRVALEIGEAIKTYETENNIKINNISFYSDKQYNRKYYGIFTYKNINESAFSTSWGDDSIVNFFNDLNLVEIDNDDNIKEMFKNMNFNEFSKDAIIFENDTVHVCLW